MIYSYSECIDRYGLKLDFLRHKVTISNPRKAQADGMLQFLALHKERLIKEMHFRSVTGRPESVIDGIKDLERMLIYRDECEDSVELLEIKRRLRILQKQYPRATAYVRMKMLAFSDDQYLSLKGTQGAKRIVACEDYREVLADISEQIKKHQV